MKVKLISASDILPTCYRVSNIFCTLFWPQASESIKLISSAHSHAPVSGWKTNFLRHFFETLLPSLQTTLNNQNLFHIHKTHGAWFLHLSLRKIKMLCNRVLWWVVDPLPSWSGGTRTLTDRVIGVTDKRGYKFKCRFKSGYNPKKRRIKWAGVNQVWVWDFTKLSYIWPFIV